MHLHLLERDKISAGFWIAWYKWANQYYLENDLGKIAEFDDWKKSRLKIIGPGKNVTGWFLLDKAENSENLDSINILGSMWEDIEQKRQPGQYSELNFYLLDSLNIQEVEHLLIQWLNERKLVSPKSVIDIRNPKQQHLPIEAKFYHSNEFIYFDLPTEKINKPWIDKSLEVDINALGLRYKIENDPEEHLIKEMAEIITHGFSSMKRKDNGINIVVTAHDLKESIELGKVSNRTNSFLLLFRGKELIGLSKVKYPRPAEIVGQAMTVIKDGYRGTGLASWMKARFYTHLIELFPEIKKFKTDCFNINLDMIHINRQMGYKETFRMNEYTYIRPE